MFSLSLLKVVNLEEEAQKVVCLNKQKLVLFIVKPKLNISNFDLLKHVV